MKGVVYSSVEIMSDSWRDNSERKWISWFGEQGGIKPSILATVSSLRANSPSSHLLLA